MIIPGWRGLRLLFSNSAVYIFMQIDINKLIGRLRLNTILQQHIIFCGKI